MPRDVSRESMATVSMYTNRTHTIASFTLSVRSLVGFFGCISLFWFDTHALQSALHVSVCKSQLTEEWAHVDAVHMWPELCRRHRHCSNRLLSLSLFSLPIAALLLFIVDCIRIYLFLYTNQIIGAKIILSNNFKRSIRKSERQSGRYLSRERMRRSICEKPKQTVSNKSVYFLFLAEWLFVLLSLLLAHSRARSQHLNAFNDRARIYRP